MYKKLIITFEGIEGSGKSFHIKNVSNYLKKKKINFIKIREPGGSKNAEKIRNLLLNSKSNFNKNTDLLLYMAARSENIEKIIHKNYKKKIILIDRFIDSTIAYQHYGMGINKTLIKNFNKYLLNNIKVDLDKVSTNLVFFDLELEQISDTSFIQCLLKQDVKIDGKGNHRFRMATHFGFINNDIEKVIKAIKFVLEK